MDWMSFIIGTCVGVIVVALMLAIGKTVLQLQQQQQQEDSVEKTLSNILLALQLDEAYVIEITKEKIPKETEDHSEDWRNN